MIAMMDAVCGTVLIKSAKQYVIAGCPQRRWKMVEKPERLYKEKI
jgi:hypothetical protein